MTTGDWTLIAIAGFGELVALGTFLAVIYSKLCVIDNRLKFGDSELVEINKRVTAHGDRLSNHDVEIVKINTRLSAGRVQG